MDAQRKGTRHFVKILQRRQPFQSLIAQQIWSYDLFILHIRSPSSCLSPQISLHAPKPPSYGPILFPFVYTPKKREKEEIPFDQSATPSIRYAQIPRQLVEDLNQRPLMILKDPYFSQHDYPHHNNRFFPIFYYAKLIRNPKPETPTTQQTEPHPNPRRDSPEPHPLKIKRQSRNDLIEMSYHIICSTANDNRVDNRKYIRKTDPRSN